MLTPEQESNLITAARNLMARCRDYSYLPLGGGIPSALADLDVLLAGIEDGRLARAAQVVVDRYRDYSLRKSEMEALENILKEQR